MQIRRLKTFALAKTCKFVPWRWEIHEFRNWKGKSSLLVSIDGMLFVGGEIERFIRFEKIFLSLSSVEFYKRVNAEITLDFI